MAILKGNPENNNHFAGPNPNTKHDIPPNLEGLFLGQDALGLQDVVGNAISYQDAKHVDDDNQKDHRPEHRQRSHNS